MLVAILAVLAFVALPVPIARAASASSSAAASASASSSALTDSAASESSSSALAAASSASQTRTIKVGYYAFDGYQMQDSDGARSGYGYDFLQELARYTGWNYEYVGYDLGWSELQKMLDDGQIDILTSARKTPAREGKYLFSTQIGTSAGILTVKSGDDRITTGEYGTYDGIRVGMIKDSSINSSFAAFAEEKGFTYTEVDFDNEDELDAALQSGDGIDAVCTTNLRRVKNEWILDEFDSQYFYVMMNLESTELQQEVDDAIAQMDLYTPGWRTKLWDEYYTPDTGDGISLTTAEKTFLDDVASDRTYTVLVRPDNAPYSYFEDGQAKGIIPELFTEVAKRAGINFTFVKTDSTSAYTQALIDRSADIIADSYFDYDKAEKGGYKMTMVYMTTSISQVTRKNLSGEANTVAVLNDGDVTFDGQIEIGDDVNTLGYPTVEACLDAVSMGKADTTYVFSYTAQEYVEVHGGSTLSVTLLPQKTMSFSISVADGNAPELLTILNKSVASLNDDYVSQVIVSQVASADSTPMNLWDFLVANPLVLALVVAMLTSLVFLVAFLVNRQRGLRVITEKNRLLSEAVQAANRASEAKSDFLSSISHDMRTPLNGIIGFTEFALQETDGQRRQEDLLKIRQSSSMLLDLVNDTLELSRIESGKFVLVPEWFSGKDFMEGITTVIKAAADDKGITFATSLDFPSDLYLRADRLKMQELFLNLLSNAVKYTNRGGNVRLSVEKVDDGAMSKSGGPDSASASINADDVEVDSTSASISALGVEVDGVVGGGDVAHDGEVARPTYRITVEDDGIGISEEFLPRIFDSFSQERRNITNAAGGSGLGLAIVKRIVDLMGGTIEVRSELGKGSAFTVTLPIETREGDMPEAGGPSDVLKGADAKIDGIIAGKRVLLCEDNTFNIEIAERLLEAKDIEVICAANGRLGVEAFEDSAVGSIDAVLMDINMPEMDGFEATRRIRALDRADATVVPIIAMTADAYAEDVQDCLAAGMNDHVAKPVDPAKLYSVLAARMA